MKKRNYSRRRMSKLQMSNNAHYKLRRRYNDTPGKKGDIFFAYHNECLKRQKTRVLSKAERRKIFGEVTRKSKSNGLGFSYDPLV